MREYVKKITENEKTIWLLVLAAFAERLIMFFLIGSGVISGSDDIAYLESGVVFANTGVISIWNTYPTASIMPGMPVICGLMYMIFGEGSAYIDSLRFVWMILGSLTVFFVYKCGCCILPRPYALFAACGMLLPNWAWSDNIVLTETPYLLFYMMCFYYVLKIGEEKGEKDRKAILGFTLSFMAALMFRANILLFLPFAIVYLLFIRKKKFISLLPHITSLALALLIFCVPWSVRNYKLFDKFIPITAGAANPGLKGTYQGESAPSDETLDYENNVYKIVREMYAEHYNEDGSLKENADMENLHMAIDRLQTRYRLKEWFKRDPGGLLWSYFVSKPACMINWVWFWLPMPGFYSILQLCSQINMLMCMAAVVLAAFTGEKRKISFFLALTYAANIYIIAMSFASERYAAMFMPLRYLLSAVALYIAVKRVSEKLILA